MIKHAFPIVRGRRQPRHLLAAMPAVRGRRARDDDVEVSTLSLAHDYYRPGPTIRLMMLYYSAITSDLKRADYCVAYCVGRRLSCPLRYFELFEGTASMPRLATALGRARRWARRAPRRHEIGRPPREDV